MRADLQGHVYPKTGGNGSQEKTGIESAVEVVKSAKGLKA